MDSIDDDPGSRKDYKTKRDSFLQTFQKPTQIYRYLKHRHDESPIFLHRTLAYLPGRMSRSHQSRKSFNINDLCRAKENKTKPFDTPANSNCPNSPSDIANPFNGRAQGSSSNNGYATDGTHGKSIYFNFLTTKAIRQLTKAKSFSCPWCFVNCFDLEPMIMHLKLCHSRFTFTHQAVAKGYRIDIRLNDNYDGSYSGYKYPGHDLLTDFKFSFNSTPMRRATFTQILFVRSRRSQSRSKSLCMVVPSMITDWVKDEESIDEPFGERLYYHTSTCLPVKANEADVDSEADNDPSWLRERTQLMIDEFVDVNDGEKQMLKLWNLHIMHNRRYIADYQIPDACREFISERGDEIISKCLFGNLILHLANLQEFGLITPVVISECVKALNAKRRCRKSATIKLESNERTGSPPRKKAAHINHINTNGTQSAV